MSINLTTSASTPREPPFTALVLWLALVCPNTSHGRVASRPMKTNYFHSRCLVAVYGRAATYQCLQKVLMSTAVTWLYIIRRVPTLRSLLGLGHLKRGSELYVWAHEWIVCGL